MTESETFPMNPTKYLIDTSWCDHHTEVAHFRMIMTYYSIGSPPKDDIEEIRKVGKIPLPDYMRVIGNLERLGWSRVNGEWRHGRIEATLAAEKKKLMKQKEQTAPARAAALSVTDRAAQPVTLSPSEIVFNERYLKRVEARIEHIRSQKPFEKNAEGDALRVELVELKVERKMVMARLGMKA